MGRREIEMGGGAEESALSVHPFPVPLCALLHSIRQAPGSCAGLCVAPQGGPCLGLANSMSGAMGDLEL